MHDCCKFGQKNASGLYARAKDLETVFFYYVFLFKKKKSTYEEWFVYQIVEDPKPGFDTNVIIHCLSRIVAEI